MDARQEDCLMTDKAKQIDKIRKLMALAAQSSNEGESANAFSRARRYMAHYGLTMEDVYGRGGSSYSSSADAERYRRDAESARQQAETERRARQAAEEKNSRYEEEKRKHSDEERTRRAEEERQRKDRIRRAEQEQQRKEEERLRQAQEEQLRQEQVRCEELRRAREAAIDEQLNSYADPPLKKKFFQRFVDDRFSMCVAACAMIFAFLIWGNKNEISEPVSVPKESVSVHKPQTPVKTESNHITVSGYSIKSQNTRYCVSDDMYDTNLLKIHRLQFANNRSLSIDGDNPLRIIEESGPGRYKLENGETIKMTADAEIESLLDGGRSYSCHATLKLADKEAENLYKKYQTILKNESAPAAPIAPPRPEPVNIYEYSANSRDTRSCLADGTEKYEDGNVAYKLQTFYFVGPSEIAYGKNTSGIRVIQPEGNGMYKLENGDEVSVDVFGSIQRYFTKKMSFTCFADEAELGHYLQSRRPQ